jgi:plastocyanin
MTRLLRVLLAPLIAALALPVALLVAPAVALAGDPCYHDFSMPLRTVSTSPAVKALDCAFAPTVTYVPVGTTVTFSNDSDFTHLVTGANQDWGSRDKELAANGSVAYTFDQAGVFPYACALHRGMVGAIVVGADSAAGLAPQTGGAAPAAAPASTTAPTAADQPMDGGRIAIAAVAGAIIALAVAWSVRGMRRPPVVKEIGS